MRKGSAGVEAVSKWSVRDRDAFLDALESSRDDEEELRLAK